MDDEKNGDSGQEGKVDDEFFSEMIENFLLEVWEEPPNIDSLVGSLRSIVMQ